MSIKKLGNMRLLKKAHLLRYASALTAHVPLKYAPLLDPCDALQLNLFEQPVKEGGNSPNIGKDACICEACFHLRR